VTLLEIIRRGVMTGILRETPMRNTLTILLIDDDGGIVSLPVTHEFVGKGDPPLDRVFQSLMRERDRVRRDMFGDRVTEYKLVPREAS
jgi:hypothetical protein